MPIDSSIISRLQPPAPLQAPDPLENYARIMGVQNAMRQGQLGQLQLTAAEKAAKDDQDYSDAFKAAGGNYEKLLPELANRGLGKQYLDVQGKILGNRKTESEIGKNNADTGLNQQKILGEAVSRGRDQLATVNTPQAAAAWTAAQFNNPVTGQLFKDSGISLEQKLAEIPTDPAKFQEWKINHILGAEKLVTHLDEVSKLAETKRSNIATEANGRISAGAAASQAGTAAARLRYDQINPPQTYDADRGITVNTKTGAASPVLQGGAPIGPKPQKPQEGYLKQQAGVENTRSAIREYQTALKGFGDLDLAKPDARANLSSKYKNALLQAKEAYNLGVLSGPDMEVLTSILTDPTSVKGMFTSKQALQNQAGELDRILGNIGKTTAAVHGQPAPNISPANPGDKVGGVLTQNPDGSFNYGAH